MTVFVENEGSTHGSGFEACWGGFSLPHQRGVRERTTATYEQMPLTFDSAGKNDPAHSDWDIGAGRSVRSIYPDTP